MGIPIRIHFTFFLLVVWYGYHSSRAGHDIALAVALLLALFASVVLHELGHAAVARRLGVRTREIVLYPIGGIARLESMPSGWSELWIALGGPAVNLVLAVLLGGILLVAAIPIGIPERLTQPAEILPYLLFVNVVLLLFNLLPAFPMDGGRVLRAVMSLYTSPERATEVAAVVGQSMSFVFAVGGILLGNPFLLIIALLVFLGATQEVLFFRQRSVVAGHRVRDAMVTRFETLVPQDSLQEAVRHLLATHQQDFPVVDAWGRPAGVLSRSTLMTGLARQGAGAAVLEVMERDCPVVGPDDDLESALPLLRARPGCPVLVVDGERLAGMLTLENLAEFVEVARRAALVGPAV